MFAAYSLKKNGETESEEKPNVSAWLTNSSFQVDLTSTCTQPETPKFSSDESTGSLKEKRVSSKNKKEKSKKKKKEKHHESKKRKKSRDRSSSREREKKKERKQILEIEVVKEKLPFIPKGTVFSNGLQLRNHQAFYEDRKGDRNNLAFPNLYSKYVARFFRSSPHFSLGGKIFRKPVAKKPKPSRYYGKRAQKRLAIIPESTPVLSSVPKLNENNPLGIYDTNTVMYIHGQKAERPEEEETPKMKTDDEAIKRQTTLYNENLRKDPNNVCLWIEFINFQDVARFETEENAECSTRGKHLNQKALLERKISILEKAINNNPKSECLINMRLQIASEFWESSALHQEWRNTLFVHPMSIYLWKKYLSFTENYFEGFSVQTVLKSYATCIQKLIQIQQPSFTSHQKPSNLEEHMIDIFMRLCTFLRRSGHSEKSTSLIQAIMELGLKRLVQLQKSNEKFNVAMIALQNFWDSCAARIGEESSNTDTVESRNINGTDLTEAEDDLVQSGQPHSVVWHKVEKLRSIEHWQSWTPAPGEEDECDDPERLVPFADISPYLFSVEKLPHVQYRLIIGSLQSLGMPLLPALQAQLFWAPDVAESDLIHLLVSASDVTTLSSFEPNLFNSPSYLAFIRRIVLLCFSHLPGPFRLELGLVWLNVERVRVKTFSKPKSAPWKDTKGWIKNLLKSVPPQDSISTLLLYNAYAGIELDAGNVEECGRILKMLLNMFPSNPLYQQDGSRAALLGVWFSHIKFLIRNNCHQDALAYLISLGAGSTFQPKSTTPSPAMTLKARRKYESIFFELLKDQSTETGAVGVFHQPDFTASFLGCYSFFLSLTEGSLSCYQAVNGWLTSTLRSDLEEFKTEQRFRAEFLRYHTRRESVLIELLSLISACRSWVKDVRPQLYHDLLFSSLKSYPKSMKMLSIFIESEERCSMFSQLWKQITCAAKSKEEESTLSAFAACLALAKREETIKKGEESAWISNNEPGVPTLYQGFRRKMEHLVENCVAQFPGCHSPTLWRVLIRSAHQKSDFQRCRTLFYRAVRDCPWSKDIFMDVVEYVPGSIKEVVGLMQEKELRLRFPLEELDVLLEPEPDINMEKLIDEDSIIKELPEEPVQMSTDESEGEFSEEFEDDENS